MTQPRRDKDAARLSRRRDEAIDNLRRLDDPTVDMLIARAKESAEPDSFPATTLNQGSNRSGVSNPTATAAERHAGGRIVDDNGHQIGLPDTWREQADPVRGTIRELEDLLAQIARLARAADRKRQYVTANPKEGRQSTVGDCQACHRTVTGTAEDPILGTSEDRLRAGYCSACYTAWGRAGYPDRHQFERTRTERRTA